MREQMIKEISTAMAALLTIEQVAELNKTLIEVVNKYEVTAMEADNDHGGESNEKLLEKFIAAKRIEGRTKPTLLYYESTIRHLLNDVPGSLLNFTAEDIRDYLSDFQQKRQSSSVTVNNIRRIFSSFFSWLEQEDYIIKSPMRRIHKVKTGTRVKSTISDEEMETLRDHCNNKRDLAMIDFLASTGIRVGELVRLNRTDINFNERECIVSGKGNKQRIVYFNARAKTHLLNYLGERVDENPALFVSLHQPTERLRISGVETRLRKLGQETGVMHVHPHKFRRTLATAAIDRGMPVEQVQRLLGHVKIDTTMQYAMVNQNNVKMSHRRYLS
jgi:site-specific recombinase XerD